MDQYPMVIGCNCSSAILFQNCQFFIYQHVTLLSLRGSKKWWREEEEKEQEKVYDEEDEKEEAGDKSSVLVLP
jgi:hypothetical protein